MRRGITSDGGFDSELGQSGMLRNRLANLEDRMRFAGVKYDGLADPLVVYRFRPGQVTQASVVIFLELSVAHIISHGRKYPPPIPGAAAPILVTKNRDFDRAQKRMYRRGGITMFRRVSGYGVLTLG